MCGISGIVHKSAHREGLAPIGEELIMMLDSLKHRGKDSSGVTVAGQDCAEDLIVRLWTDCGGGEDEVLARVEESILECGGVVKTKAMSREYLRLTVNYEGAIGPLADSLISTRGVHIHSMGRVSEVIKDLDAAVDVDQAHGVSDMRGTHGIGHVRMATESRVDINHSHPFWAYPFPDVTVVHNGQLSNYHKLKRKYQDRGYRFQTENDSEVIAVYLADKLADGLDLEDALGSTVDDLDGTFTFLVSTANGIGYAKDRWSAKPLVTMETDDVVAVASEEVALRCLFSDEIERVEPQEGAVKTWLI